MREVSRCERFREKSLAVRFVKELMRAVSLAKRARHGEISHALSANTLRGNRAWARLTVMAVQNDS